MLPGAKHRWRRHFVGGYVGRDVDRDVGRESSNSPCPSSQQRGKRRLNTSCLQIQPPFPSSQPYVCSQHTNLRLACTQTPKQTIRSPLSRSGLCILCHYQGKLYKKETTLRLLLQPDIFMNRYQIALWTPISRKLCAPGPRVCVSEMHVTGKLPGFGNKTAAILGRVVRLHQRDMGTERFLMA